MSSITGVPLPDPEEATQASAGGTGRRGDVIFGSLSKLAGLTIIAIVVLVGIFLVAKAVPAIADDKENFLTSSNWSTSPTMAFGIVQLLWTTVVTSIIALIIAVPFAIGIALFLTQYAPKWLSGPAAAVIDLLAAVPSIVFGLWGLYVVAPKFQPAQNWLSDTLGWIPLFKSTAVLNSGKTILFIGIVLAIMILPIITAMTRETFAQTPQAHKDAATALGATKWEMIRTAVLPFGKPGIISASMLGLGRALGETVAVMMILSTLPDGTPWNASLLNGGQTFASIIANNAPETTNDITQMGAYIAAGLVLFVLTFVVNAMARVVIERRKAFSE